MPFQRLLDGLASDVSGVQAALLLDSEGEVAFETGASDDRHRLIGAYQGIALQLARKTARRYAVGAIRYIVCRYEWGQVVLRPLDEGYYLLVSLAPEVGLANALHRSEELEERLNREL